MRYPTAIKRSVLVVLAVCLLQIPLAHSALIGIQPGTTSASTGDLISLDLVISGLGNYAPASLGAFDISIGFDATALSFTSYSLGGYLGNVGLSEAINVGTGATGGSVNVAEVSLLSAIGLDTLQPGAFTLATLNFTVINLGGGAATQLSVLPSPVLADANGSALPVTTAGPASIQSVPAPGTLLLLITGLFAWLVQVKRYSSLPQMH
jgi:hypothetical protein